MTYEQVVARLNAAIDHGTPEVDGNATAIDEGTARNLLERLQAAHDRMGAPSSPTPSGPSYNRLLAAREDRIDQAFLAWDRSVRALWTRLQDLAPRYPDAETVPVELRGEIVNETIRALDPATPLSEPPIGCLPTVHGRRAKEMFRGIGRDEYDAACDVAVQAAVNYDRARTSPLPRRVRSSIVYSDSAGDAYFTALREAEAFCAYLNAVATPDGVA